METVLTACRIGDIRLLKSLLAHQSPRRADSKGYTGLHWAVKRYYIECVEILLADRRLSVNAKTKDSGSTALHLCLSSRLRKNKRLLLMKMLISKGADMNIRCHGDLTPLHLAAREGHLECLELLLQSGADFTVTDANGHTALETAKLWGKRECARHLAAVEWASLKNKQSNETVDRRLRKEYADREKKEVEAMGRFWEASWSFQWWIGSKGFSVMENKTAPENCEQRLINRMSTPSPTCEACELPEKPPDLQTALRQSKPKPIEVSFRAKRQHYPTSYLLSGIQPKEKGRSRKKTPIKGKEVKKQETKGEPMKCKEREKLETATQPVDLEDLNEREEHKEEIVEEEEKEQEWKEEAIKQEGTGNETRLTHTRSLESLADTKPIDIEHIATTKSLTALEESFHTTCKPSRKEKKEHSFRPPSLLSRLSQSPSNSHSRTCQAWGKRPTTQPNAFIWVPPLRGHVTSATPNLVVEPKPLHFKRGSDRETIDCLTSRVVNLGEGSKSISRYRGYKGSL